MTKAGMTDLNTRARLTLIAVCMLGTYAAITLTPNFLSHTGTSLGNTFLTPHSGAHRVSKPLPIASFKTRSDLGVLLEQESLKRGVELGVKAGVFAEITLRNWKSATEYVLVDLWAHQQNYKDFANVDNSTHNAFKREAIRRTAQFIARGTDVHVCQGLTINCAKQFRDGYFDYVYVDARHDYKGVLEDITTWWSKLRHGGIMAGHDYVTNHDGPLQMGQDWSINYDGTRDPSGRAVKGAVDDFARNKKLQVVLAYREAGHNSWALRKP